MKKQLFQLIIAPFILFTFPNVIFGQSPTPEHSANPGLFSRSAIISNPGNAQTIGDVCTDSGSSISSTYNNNDFSNMDINLPSLFGRSLVLTPYTCLMCDVLELTDTLYLNALGHSNAIFVIKIKGDHNPGMNSKIILINGAQSKNVYWKVDEPIKTNNYTVYRGTTLCNNGGLEF